MSDINEADLTALLAELRDQAANGYKTCQYAALTALVAERDALRKENDELRSRCKIKQDEVLDRVFEMDAMRKRVAELEAQQPASDLRERLVCAALMGILANYESRNHGADDVAEWAVVQADATLSAMRKGGAHGK